MFSFQSENVIVINGIIIATIIVLTLSIKIVVTKDDASTTMPTTSVAMKGETPTSQKKVEA